MSVNWPEQQRRARLHLCVWCAEPARLLRTGKHGVHCERHAKIIAENYKAWVKRKRSEAKQPRKIRFIVVPRLCSY